MVIFSEHFDEQSEHSGQSEQCQLSLRTAILLGLSVPRSLKCLALLSCSLSKSQLTTLGMTDIHMVATTVDTTLSALTVQLFTILDSLRRGFVLFVIFEFMLSCLGLISRFSNCIAMSIGSPAWNNPGVNQLV